MIALVKYSVHKNSGFKERRWQLLLLLSKCVEILFSTYCPSNIYTLSDEVIAAVFAINSSASTAAPISPGEDADIAWVLGRGHDLHLPPSSRPRTLANDCVSVSA